MNKTINKQKTALITGVTGQDGSFLAKYLLSLGYYVVGIKRRSSTINTERIDDIYSDKNFKLEYGDITDVSSIYRILYRYSFDEIYNLAAQSHVRVSFENPVYTFDTTAVGTLNLLEAVLNICPRTKIYQASSSEIFGSTPAPQNEESQFNPQSPYAIGKLAAYHFVKNYRYAYALFASNGILFNHESELRGETFVTRKITLAIANMKFNKQDCVYLGNLDAKRDWGYAGDYVKAMNLMLQYEKADDFVIATGEMHSVREFCNEAFRYAFGSDIEWYGSGRDEYGIVDGRPRIKIDRKYFRPTEVNELKGNYSKAKKVLGWKPEMTFKQLVHKMVDHDIEHAKIKYRFV